MIVLSFLIGVCLASFIMVLAEPLSPLWRRSLCDDCHQPLRWHQLIPVISSWFLRRPCSNCHHQPHFIYGLIEVVIGILFVVTASVDLLNWTVIIVDIFILISLHVSLWDWRWRQIPVIDLIWLTSLTVLYLYLQGRLPVSSLVMFGLLTVLLIVWRFRKKPFPLASGDWVLLIIASSWITLENLPIFLTIAGGLGILTAVIYKRYYQTPYFPFAPAILMATWVCVVVLKIQCRV